MQTTLRFLFVTSLMTSAHAQVHYDGRGVGSGGNGQVPLTGLMTKTRALDLTGMKYMDMAVKVDHDVIVFFEVAKLHAYATCARDVRDYDVVPAGAPDGRADAIAFTGLNSNDTLQIAYLDRTVPGFVTVSRGSIGWFGARGVSGARLDGNSNASIVAVAASGAGLLRLDDPWGQATETLIPFDEPRDAHSVYPFEWDGDPSSTEFALGCGAGFAIVDAQGAEIHFFPLNSEPHLAVASEAGSAFETLVAAFPLASTEYVWSLGSQQASPLVHMGPIGITGIAIGDSNADGYPNLGIHQTFTEDEILFRNRRSTNGSDADLYGWSDYDFFDMSQIGVPPVDPLATDKGEPEYHDLDNDDDADYCTPLQQYGTLGISLSGTNNAAGERELSYQSGTYRWEPGTGEGTLRLDVDPPSETSELVGKTHLVAIVYVADGPTAPPLAIALPPTIVDVGLNTTWPLTVPIRLDEPLDSPRIFNIVMRLEEIDAQGNVVDASPSSASAFTTDWVAGVEFRDTHPDAGAPVSIEFELTGETSAIDGDRDDDGGMGTPIPTVDCMVDEDVIPDDDVIPSRCR